MFFFLSRVLEVENHGFCKGLPAASIAPAARSERIWEIFFFRTLTFSKWVDFLKISFSKMASVKCQDEREKTKQKIVSLQDRQIQRSEPWAEETENLSSAGLGKL